jgi:hypothetical protein
MCEILLSCQLVWMHEIVYGKSLLSVDKTSFKDLCLSAVYVQL